LPKAPDEDERLEGRYANCFNVGHNSVEFVLDFGQFYSGSERRMHTRIVTNPKYAKALLDTLQRAIDEYERSFGIID
jgi:hypothetical protein